MSSLSTAGCVGDANVLGDSDVKVPVLSRKDRKKQERTEKLLEEQRQLREQANCVNKDGDNPFSVTWEHDKGTEGSRDISLQRVAVSVNGKVLFKDTQVRLSAGARYGLMGPNGRGKSTILRLLNSRELPVQSNLELLLVEQEQEFHESEVSAVQAVLQSHKKQREFASEAAQLSEKTELSHEEMERLNFLEEELDIMGAAQAEARARRILFGLGFPTEWHERPTSSFSGGWRKRIALAAAVFIEPDVLMLDEPTNHLDLNAVIWLESYLCEQYNEKARRPKTLVVVSHDAGFLDEVCTHMVHVENYQLNYYRGGFSGFDEQLRQRHQEIDKKYATFNKTINEKKRNGMSNAQVDEWIKDQVRTGRLDPIYLEKRRDYIVNFPFSEPPELPDGYIVKLEDVSFNYPGGPVLFHKVSCALWADSRITLCGPNGIGKSTLLSLLTGQLEPTEGIITMNRKVRIGRYNQHFVDKLPLEKTSVEFIQSLGIREEDKARRQLGSFGLEGIVHKNQIATLSGGQKARVALAAISAEKPHFLLFDEPTNHLDVESIEALCHAIKNFKGGVLVVTHDARLIEETDMQIWEAGNQNVRPFNGSLNDYKNKVRGEFEEQEKKMLKERQIATEEKQLNSRLAREGAGKDVAALKKEKEEETRQRQLAELDAAFALLDKRKKVKKVKKDKEEKANDG
ncbi:ABC transporter, putative [Trypanosoma brucei gambiense DAL972]|uniref:ATP-binding cassette protein, putative n=2 Tax=Trypanosoma brucei TaxID=5691 RepID=D0A4N3_TRYB9|nr:ABC transporter, putative [Trypanosoma brucei gambiense DAL972]RHW69962.1 ATP-binding cassette sub-family F member 1 [Trypanosoma brucei equiperdum]CBH16227.1 ABC transporter, putative [Trypanosoma brucei gambiense DAL972]|eukprot:XP_011778491.1 ABC transporter, putative [Trypanosoma brucei gambiense DAL972]